MKCAMIFTKSESKVLKESSIALYKRMYQSIISATTRGQARAIWEDCKMLFVFAEESNKVETLRLDKYVRSMILSALDDMMQTASEAEDSEKCHTASVLFNKIEAFGKAA